MSGEPSLEQTLAGFRLAQRRRSLLVGAVTAGALLVSFVILAVILQRVDREIDAKQRELGSVQHELYRVKETLDRERLNLDSLVRDMDAKAAQLAKISAELAEKENQVGRVHTLVEELPKTPLTNRIKRVVGEAPVTKPASVAQATSLEPIEKVSQVRLSLSPTKGTFLDRPIYTVRIWIDVPKSRVSEVLKAEYHFDHESFVPKSRTAFDPDTGFALTYRGYGCVDAEAALVGRDGTKHPLPFDMCGSWVAAMPR